MRLLCSSPQFCTDSLSLVLGVYGNVGHGILIPFQPSNKVSCFRVGCYHSGIFKKLFVSGVSQLTPSTTIALFGREYFKFNKLSGVDTVLCCHLLSIRYSLYMPASENVNGIQFSFHKGNPKSPIGEETRHKVTAKQGDLPVGELEWFSRGNNAVSNVYVREDFRRQGVATRMWDTAHEAASSTRGVKPPKHSKDRTNAGDAWAKSVGGRVPSRSKWEPKPL
jgi:hypothetical protein